MATKARSVVWTPTAQELLDEAVAHIALDSVDAAFRVLEVILDAADSLAYLSLRGRVVPEIQKQDVREIFVYSYRLMYQVDASEVRILAIVHGARDFASWLRQNALGGGDSPHSPPARSKR